MSNASIDVAALAWLLPELSKTIASARVRLAHAANVTGPEAVKQLLHVKRLTHEAKGALEVVGAKSVVHYLHSLEMLLEQCAAQSDSLDSSNKDLRQGLDAHAHATLDDACHTFISYLHEQQQSQVSLQALVLYPQYQAMRSMMSLQDAVLNDYHAVDLFFPDLSPRLARQAPVYIEAADKPLQLNKLRPLFEALILKVFNASASGKETSDLAVLMAILADQSAKDHQYSFWKACEAAIQGISGVNAFSADQMAGFKRWLGRVNLQIQRVIAGSSALSERILREALFYIALTDKKNQAEQTGLQRELIRIYQLSGSVPDGFEQARYAKPTAINDRSLIDKVLQLKDAWDEAQPTDLPADGIKIREEAWLRRLNIAQQALLDIQLRLSEQGLDVPTIVIKSLANAVDPIIHAKQRLTVGLGLEGASAILWLERLLSTLGVSKHDQRTQAQLIVTRIMHSAQGTQTVATPTAPSHASEHQVRAQVVHEAKLALSLVEKQLDDVFRYGQTSTREGLNLLPLSQTASALRVVDLPHLSQAIDALFERVAQLLPKIEVAAIEVQDGDRALIDAASQPIAKLFSQITAALEVFTHAPTLVQQDYFFDVKRFELSNRQMQQQSQTNASVEATDLGSQAFESIESFNQQRRKQLQTLTKQSIINPHDTQTQQALAQSLQTVRDDAALTGDLELAAMGSSPIAPIDARFSSGQTGVLALEKPMPVASENELYAIFITEAQEVLADSTQLLHDLEAAPQNLVLLKDIRRGFHTLKGSARMVGFQAFGDAAWHIEQTVNTALSRAAPATIDLIQFMRCGRDALSEWLLQLDDALLNIDGDDVSADTIEQLTVSSTLTGFASQLAPYLQAISRGFERQTPISSPSEISSTTVVANSILTPTVQTPQLQASVPPQTSASVKQSEPISLPILPSAATQQTPAVPSVAAPQRAAPAIRLVANNEGMRPQDFIDKARAAVAMAQAAQAAEVSSLTHASLADGLQELQAVHIAPLPTPVIQTAQDTMVSIGPLRLPKQLYAIYLQEAGGHIAALQKYMADMRLNAEKDIEASTRTLNKALVVGEPVSYDAYKYAHSLKGSAATIGFSVLKDIASPLEQVLQAAHESKQALHGRALTVVGQAVDVLAAVFAQFSTGTYPAAQPKISDALASLPKPQPVSNFAHTLQTHIAQPVLVPSSKSPLELNIETKRISQAAIKTELAPVDDLALSLLQFNAMRLTPTPTPTVGGDDIDDPEKYGGQDDTHVSVDEIDADIWFDFVEEADQLLPRIQTNLNVLANNIAVLDTLRRDLHTLKGGARMVGAMRLGAMVHGFESTLENCVKDDVQQKMRVTTIEKRLEPLDQVESTQWLNPDAHEQVLLAFDAVVQTYSALKLHDTVPTTQLETQQVDSTKYFSEFAQTNALFDSALSAHSPAATVSNTVHPEQMGQSVRSLADISVLNAVPAQAATVGSLATPASSIVLTPTSMRAHAARALKTTAASSDVALPALRMRTDMLDLWVNQATEVAGSKGRLDQHVLQLRQSLHELTDNVERLRQQLREIEIQAESQMATRTELASVNQTTFDPLEFDRFTRFQELTRMLSESLGDMLTVRDAVAKTLQEAEQDLINQSKANKAMTQSLIRSRLLAFDAISDRLYRVVRQSSRELGKQVHLDIQGGHFTLDRSILERMTASLEHMVRNSVVHGIESPAARLTSGKNVQGLISLAIKQQGNELELVLSDDGAGLPLASIRDMAIAKGLLKQQSLPTVQQLTEFIFAPGFSTAQTVTELAGRGVGMDVVRSDIIALGGRITLATTTDKGARFTIRIPLTLAINQVLMVVAQDTQYAIPSSLIQSVVTVKSADLAQAYNQGSIVQQGIAYPFAHLAHLLKIPTLSTSQNRSASLVLVSNGNDTVAVHVDSVVGNQESIIKPLNSFVTRIPGLSSATLLNNGKLCLILDPVQLHLAAQYGDSNTANSKSTDSIQIENSVAEQAALVKVAAHTPKNLVRSAAGTYELASQIAPRSTDLQMAHVLTSTSSVDIDVISVNGALRQAQNSKLVMVVDDSLTVRKVTQKLLVREGWDVLLAKDGIDALEQLQTASPAVMLVDIEMPRMDGFDLTRNVRADDKLKAIPIIMITSRIADKHRDHAFSLGVNAYMGKPYRDDELLAEMLKLTLPASSPLSI